MNNFTIIPGVGKSISQDLVDLGFTEVDDLKNQNPEKMYKDLEKLRGTHIDKCVLYVFRCSVYFSETKNPNPELLKWWNWKDN
jgi:hypothetical protein